MEKHELTNLVENRETVEVYSSMLHQLHMVEPNGAYVHALGNYKCNLHWWLDRYKRGMDPQGEKFRCFRERNPEQYDQRLNKMQDIMKKFNVLV